MTADNLVDRARNNRMKAIVKFSEFMKLYRMNKDALFCAVEGEDGKYYGLRIRISLGVDPLFFNLGGKRGVLDFYKIIKGHKEYCNLDILYFIDRDFDPLVNDGKIYETPCYSIENFYTSTVAFEKILQHEFKLYPYEDDYQRCLNLFIQRQCEFHNCAMMLNAWIACQRDLNNSGVGTRLNLNSLELKKLITIKLDGVSSNYNLEQLGDMFTEAPQISQEIILEKIKHFESPQKQFRGKFEVYFLKTFIDLLAEDCNRKNPTYVSSKKSIKLNVSGTSVITVLSSYAETPECLITYLHSSISA